jgi:hypothetical protein
MAPAAPPAVVGVWRAGQDEYLSDPWIEAPPATAHFDDGDQGEAEGEMDHAQEAVATDVIEWLLDADPSIRWQAMRDLTDAPVRDVEAERAKVARTGWGARLLELQDDSGTWADGMYGPPYLGVTFTLDLLSLLGVDPDDDRVAAAVGKVRHLRWEEWDDLPYFSGEVEPCVNGRILSQAAYFGRLGGGSDRIVDRLLVEQLPDGGWNCEAPHNSSVSSFDTTICVLEGLREHETAAGPVAEITEARCRGEEYMLERRLFRRKSTGEVIDQQFVDFGFPPQYFYDVLRGLEYFRAAGREPEERMREAIDLVRQKRQADGRWLLDSRHREWGGLFFTLGEDAGAPSRWNTLRALRVLRWAESAGF